MVKLSLDMPRAKREDGEAKECLRFQKQRSALQLLSTCGSLASHSGCQHSSGSHNGMLWPCQGLDLFRSSAPDWHHLDTQNSTNA